VVALVDESNGELGSDWEVGVRCGVEDDLGEDIMRFGCTYFVTSWLFSHPPPPLRTTPMSLAKNPLRIFGFSSRKKEEEEIGEKKKRVMDQERPISFFFSLSLSNLSFLFRAPILLLPIHQDLFHIQKAIISIQKQQHSIQLPKTPIVQTSNTTIPIAALYLDQATIHPLFCYDG